MSTYNFTGKRSITFEIPGEPNLQVTAWEQNGSLIFNLQTIGDLEADLRGFYFNLDDTQDLNSLSITGDDAITASDFGNVSSFKNGNNIKGIGHKSFDVGVDIGTSGIGSKGDDISSTTFTLSSSSGNLTLDSIAHMDFAAVMTSIGAENNRQDGQKISVQAPAAPDAIDDVYDIFEDSTSGVDIASAVPVASYLELTSNDTDADGDILTIIDFQGISHGTVERIDSDGDGNFEGINYTPDKDFSGVETFYYAISDNNGGTDFAQATINIEAVADIPDLSYEILKGNSVNEIVVRVTATQTDADSSEFIDRILLDGIPQNVSVSESSYNPEGEVDQIVKEFTLTLPKEENINFDLGITAVSKEASNGDEEIAYTSATIEYTATFNDISTTFEAEDQSMWNSGGAFQFNDNRFWGAQGTADFDANAGVGYLDVYGTYRFGLESDLHIDGGLVDAEAAFSIDVNSYFNHTTDWFRLETGAFNTIGSSWFTTSSPNLTYSLDLVGDVDMDLEIGAEVDLSKDVATGWSLLDVVTSWVTHTFSFDESTTENIDLGFDLDLLAFNGSNFYFGPTYFKPYFEDSYSWNLGDFFTLTVEVPHIDSSSHTLDGNTLTARGTTADEDGNFIQLSFDVDQAIASLAVLPVNPFGDSITIASIFEVGYDLVNYELFGNLDLGQNYFMDILNLDGQIVFEDNTRVDFTFGDNLDFTNASQKDINNDGFVEYAVLLSPEAKFYSDFFLMPSLGHRMEIAKIYGSIDTPWPFSNIGVDVGPAATPVDGTLLTTDIHLVGMPEFVFEFESQLTDMLIA